MRPPRSPQPLGRRVTDLLPGWLRRHLAVVLGEQGAPLYLAGGVVRDLLRGVTPADIDLTVRDGARAWAARLAELCGGALVVLGRDEDAARVVSGRVSVDFAAFREGATDILDDLTRRDLTINAMALRIDPLLLDPGADAAGTTLLDPTGGWADLAAGVVRATGPEAFTADPLRLLRVFRFAACLDFRIDPGTLAMAGRQGGLIVAPAPERIAHELDLIMASNRAHRTCAQMAETGLLGHILPELQAGSGMLQPASHHLDVLGHSLEALRHLEALTLAPRSGFPVRAGRWPPTWPPGATGCGSSGRPCSTTWANRSPARSMCSGASGSPSTITTRAAPSCSARWPGGCAGATAIPTMSPT